MSLTDAERPKDRRPILLEGHKVGLALMLKEDVPALARWNQDLEFTARIGHPGEAHSLEMRQEFYDKHSRMRPDSVEFAMLLLATGQLIGFGGLFDISRAMTATLFVGIGEREHWGKGPRHRGDPSHLRIWLFSFGAFTASKWKSTATIDGRSASMNASVSSWSEGFVMSS